jgi:hypothetical protein
MESRIEETDSKLDNSQMNPFHRDTVDIQFIYKEAFECVNQR